MIQFATKTFERHCSSIGICPQMKTRHTVAEDTASTEPNHAQRAELIWSRAAQIQLLQDPHFEKLKGQFGFFLDENGVWRCGGRLSKAEIPYGVKHPILLPRQHHLTTLVVQRAHSREWCKGNTY